MREEASLSMEQFLKGLELLRWRGGGFKFSDREHFVFTMDPFPSPRPQTP